MVLFSRGNIWNVFTIKYLIRTIFFFFLIIIGVNVLLSYQKFRNKCIYNVTLIFLNVVLTFTVKFQKTYLSFFFSLFLLLCLLYHVIFRSYLVGQNCLSRTFFSYLLIIVDIIIDTSWIYFFIYNDVSFDFSFDFSFCFFLAIIFSLRR